MKCGAFDSGLTIHPDGKATPCCLFDINLAKDVENLDWENPWQDLRDGKGCNACRKGGPVYRDTFDDMFRDTFAVRYLDIRNSNLCNMECVICNSYYSSKWAERLGNTEKFVKKEYKVDLDKVQRIYFAGGEPFLNKTHWETLERIENPEKVKLIYSSNLVTVKGFEKHWHNFNEVFLNASLDGVGKFGEQVRPGLKWDKWQENLDTILEYNSKHNNIKIEIACTVSLANIWHLKDIEDFAAAKGISVRFDALEGPLFLSVSAIPQELKEQIEYIPTQRIRDLLDIDEEYLFRQAVSNILLGDKLRGTNLWDYLPYNQWAINNILDYK